MQEDDVKDDEVEDDDIEVDDAEGAENEDDKGEDDDLEKEEDGYVEDDRVEEDDEKDDNADVAKMRWRLMMLCWEEENYDAEDDGVEEEDRPQDRDPHIVRALLCSRNALGLRTFHKSHFVREFTGKIPQTKIADQTFRERAQHRSLFFCENS